jgi:hypothetical protein
MKKLQLIKQEEENQVLNPVFEILNFAEMQKIKGGDGDPQDDFPPPPPPPPGN